MLEGYEVLERPLLEGVEAVERCRGPVGHHGAGAEVERADHQPLPDDVGGPEQAHAPGTDTLEAVGRQAVPHDGPGEAAGVGLAEAGHAELVVEEGAKPMVGGVVTLVHTKREEVTTPGSASGCSVQASGRPGDHISAGNGRRTGDAQGTGDGRVARRERETVG